MHLIPWRKRGEMMTIEKEMEDLWGRFFGTNGDSTLAGHLPSVFEDRFLPAMNVSETESDWRVTLELPGMSEEDIEVELMGRQLVVSGERKWKDEKKDKEFHRVESRFGSFRRMVTLPDMVRPDPDAVEARFEKGVLEIRVPKTEPTPVAKIAVKAPD